MPRTFAVVLLATTMSVGLAQAKGHKHAMSACGEGKQATAACACGKAAKGRPLLCKKGQWCHAFFAPTCTQ
jgi:hypothetical protein